MSVLKMWAMPLAAAGMLFSAGSANAAAVGETIDWKGVTWSVYGEGGGTGNATIEAGTGDLLLNQTGGTAFGVRVNRLPTVVGGASSINANGTPFIQFAYQGITNPLTNIDVAIQDETISGQQPRLFAGSLFGFPRVAGATYGPSSNRVTDYVGFNSTDGLTTSIHDVTIGKDAAGNYRVDFDAFSAQSDVVAQSVGDFDFNDVAIRIRNAVGEEVRFTDFDFGDDFVIPEPTSLALLGLGGLALISRRSRKSSGA